jgi:hypothetical protein
LQQPTLASLCPPLTDILYAHVKQSRLIQW